MRTEITENVKKINSKILLQVKVILMSFFVITNLVLEYASNKKKITILETKVIKKVFKIYPSTSLSGLTESVIKCESISFSQSKGI